MATDPTVSDEWITLARELMVLDASKHRKGMIGRCTACGLKWPCKIKHALDKFLART